ncbi:MAG: hypothetical protein GF331_14990 [Chitinivibrionales bacterium]|nr:hypothetical protein [Chitinivibrionales bacterium]
MMKRSAVAVAVVAVSLFLSNCTVDCKVCGSGAGGAGCETVTEVDRGDCEACTQEIINEAIMQSGVDPATVPDEVVYTCKEL